MPRQLNIGVAGFVSMTLLLNACAALRPLPEVSLAAPGALPAREFQQLIVADHRGQSVQLLVAGRIDARTIELAALSPEGASLFTLKYDGVRTNVAYQLAAPSDKQLPPAAILADLQLVYWPLAALREHYGARWQVQEQTGQRILLFDGKPVERVVYRGADPWSAPVELEHLRYGYHLTITTLSHTLLP